MKVVLVLQLAVAPLSYQMSKGGAFEYEFLRSSLPMFAGIKDVKVLGYLYNVNTV